MRSVNAREAKAMFSELLAAAVRGEETIVTKNGRPIAKLVRYMSLPIPGRGFGTARGLLEVPDDFDEPLPKELLRSFE